MGRLIHLFVMTSANPQRARLLEAILLAPLLILTGVGAILWGGYFWIGLQLQHISDRAAQAAALQADDRTREQTARAAVVRGLARAHLSPAAGVVFLDPPPGRGDLHLQYDTGGEGFRALASLFPAPPSTIVRTSPVQALSR
jgi:hypothetical protein